LIFLCLYSCSSPSMRHIYFLKMSSGSIDIYFGWRYHCVLESGQTNCFFDNVIEYPLGNYVASTFWLLDIKKNFTNCTAPSILHQSFS
jgi:hypothetical protein